LDFDFREALSLWAGQLVFPPASGDAKPPTAAYLTFADKQPESVAKPPALAGTVWWATADADGTKIVVAAARGAKDSLSLVVAEASQGDLSAAAPTTLIGRPRRDGKTLLATTWTTSDRSPGGGYADIGGKKVGVQVTAQAATLTGRVNAS